MLPDKQIKKEFKLIAQKNPEKYYPVITLKELGFSRKQCSNCSTFFWTVTEREICDDPQCVGLFRFIGDPPGSKRLDYIQVWKEFSSMFKKFGYTPISRYPVVARWNPTMDYTIASIAAFQPYVVSGEVEPPANPLVIPQFCLRFNDIDNVGITGHMSGFTMIGQHTFVSPKDYDINKYFREIYEWLTKGLGLPKNEITFHEDAWAGGGNFGSSMEFFTRGLEVGNQVYMQYEQTPSGKKELPIKVLDMGMGHERNAWVSQGSFSVYDTVFPNTMRNLYNKTGINPDTKFMEKFMQNSSILNIDEVDDIDQAWKTVAKNMNVDLKDLRSKVVPLSQLYSVAEHMRSSLFVLADGGLPSNVGGGYNLRMIIRRSLGFIEKNGWDVSLNDVTSWHADYLKKMYPELKEKLDQVHAILDVEKRKYNKTREKTKQIVAKLSNVSEEKLLQLYNSQGISPDMIPGQKTPDDFYMRAAELHEKRKHVAATNKEEVSLGDLEETKSLYFDDYKLLSFKAKVLKIIEDVVVLGKTAFYPTSGGQMHDVGTINGCEVTEILKQGAYVLHKVKGINFKEGDIVEGKIDEQRRIQLAQHHTATHIINTAARRVLGEHINQAGAFKDVDKARIDITHYDSLTNEEIKKIEAEANKIIEQQIPIEKKFYPRSEAEKLFGVNIYQGGVAPGRMLRIVNIVGVDVEACGGTHLDNTAEAQGIKILKSSKIQDGIIRITFTAGKAAEREGKQEGGLLLELQGLLGCDNAKQIPARAQELFSLWKKVVKKKKDVEKKLISTEEFEGDILIEAAKILKTQQEHLIKTVKRFLEDLGL
jgi:alanyl-tRNA synthetase